MNFGRFFAFSVRFCVQRETNSTFGSPGALGPACRRQGPFMVFPAPKIPHEDWQARALLPGCRRRPVLVEHGNPGGGLRSIPDGFRSIRVGCDRRRSGLCWAALDPTTGTVKDRTRSVKGLGLQGRPNNRPSTQVLALGKWRLERIDGSREHAWLIDSGNYGSAPGN